MTAWYIFIVLSSKYSPKEKFIINGDGHSLSVSFLLFIFGILLMNI